MDKILFVTSIYRTGEKIFPIIPELTKHFSVDLLTVNEMCFDYDWYGNDDLRIKFFDQWGKYFDNSYESSYEDVKPGNLDLTPYKFVLLDDLRPRYNLDKFYDFAKQCNTLVIGNTHGNISKPHITNGYQKAFDKVFVIGQSEFNRDKGNVPDGVMIRGGLPSCDKLKDIENSGDHILVICNFLGNRWGPFYKFDRSTIENLKLKELQDKLNIPIKFKLKSRADHPYPQEDFDYIDSIAYDLNYSTIMDIGDDSELVAKSKIVISPPSTMAFKSILKNIPTILIKEFGDVALYETYQDLYSFNDDLFSIYLDKLRGVNYSEFIVNSVEGGIDFSSIDVYMEELLKL
ncbi:MAG: hypothetical protein H8E03_00905 [Pelagibacteraceae bacterium]|nr:hypothetical protein [Pelagibacteraceae bacterium]